MLDLLYIARFDFLARDLPAAERVHVDPRNGFVPVNGAGEPVSRLSKRRDRYGVKPEASGMGKQTQTDRQPKPRIAPLSVTDSRASFQVWKGGSEPHGEKKECGTNGT